MPVNKKYANQMGITRLADTSEANGSWVAPSEIYKQKLLEQWPVVLAGATYSRGDVFYLPSQAALSSLSGANNDFYPCDGSVVFVTDAPELFALIGDQFGGDGLSTFAMPFMSGPTAGPIYPYAKGRTDDPALSNVTISGEGVLPAHTHSLNVGIATNTPQASNGNGGATNRPSFTFACGADTNSPTDEFKTQEGIHNELIPVIANSAGNMPIGAIFQYLPITSNDDYASLLPPNCIVPSGQELNLLELPSTYNTLSGYLGHLYGSGTGSNTVVCPDLRGTFLRGLPANSSQPSGEIIPDSFEAHQHTVTAFSRQGGNRRCDRSGISQSATGPQSGVSSVGLNTENRPPNVYVAFCMVATQI